MGHALVADAVKVTIQCGENWWGTQEMLDVMKIGGVTGWLRAAALAQIHGMLVSNHLWPEIDIESVASHLACNEQVPLRV